MTIEGGGLTLSTFVSLSTKLDSSKQVIFPFKASVSSSPK